MTTKMITEMQRRDFLAYGSSGVLSVAFAASDVAAWSGLASPFTPANASADKLISVGYLPGSARLAGVEQASRTSEAPSTENHLVHRQATSVHGPLHPHLIAAQTLPEGDPRFAYTGARLSIHGLFPSEAFKMYPELNLWAVDVEFKTLHGPLMFHAWCFQNQLVPQSSSPFSFFVPVTDVLCLTFSIKRNLQNHPSALSSTDPPAPCEQRASLQFSLGREANIPKLRRGVYVIALPSAQTGALPRWNAYQLQAADPADPVSTSELYRCDRRCKKQKVDDFAYVKLAVDYHRHSDPTHSNYS